MRIGPNELSKFEAIRGIYAMLHLLESGELDDTNWDRIYNYLTYVKERFDDEVTRLHYTEYSKYTPEKIENLAYCLMEV